MPQLLAIAEYITKTRAICMVCGNPANHTQRLVHNADRVLLGAHGTYEARCRRCFDPTLSRHGHRPYRLRIDPGARPGQNRPVMLVDLLPQVLFVLGLGFLVANVRARQSTWRAGRAAKRGRAGRVARAPKPPFYAMSLAIGVRWAACCCHALFVPRAAARACSARSMMFVYYAVLLPLSTRIAPRALRRRHLDRLRLHALRPDWRSDVAGAGKPPSWWWPRA